jgi:hypothetical protein
LKKKNICLKKKGTYKGLDISIGNSEKEAGGILIRCIQEVKKRR